MIELARADLAWRLSIDPLRVSVLRDSAEKILLVVGDRLYIYRVTNGEVAFEPSGEADGGRAFVPPPGFRH